MYKVLTLELALQAVELWITGHFDTVEIAEALELRECDVANVIHVMREAERGVIAA